MNATKPSTAPPSRCRPKVESDPEWVPVAKVRQQCGNAKHMLNEVLGQLLSARDEHNAAHGVRMLLSAGGKLVACIHKDDIGTLKALLAQAADARIGVLAERAGRRPASSGVTR